MQHSLRSVLNPKPKLRNIKDEGPSLEAEIVTKDNSPVEMMILDKGRENLARYVIGVSFSQEHVTCLAACDSPGAVAEDGNLPKKQPQADR